MTARRRRSWWKLGLWSGLGAALLLAASLHVVPWLGRRGDLNPMVEGMLASAFKVPVRIGNVFSEPLSGLTVTRLESVQARAEGRLHFKARSISVYYNPIDLLGGRLRSMILDHPEVFLNLDAPLGELTQLPTPPSGASQPADGRVIPVTAQSFVVDGGDLTFRREGRDLPLSDLRVQIWRLGEERGQEVTLSVNALGGRVRASGILDIESEPGSPPRYVIRTMEASAKGISAAGLARWALGWRPASAAETGGTIDVQCSLEGTWPEKVAVLLTTRATGLAASPAYDAAVEEAALGLRIEATVLGDFERVVFSATSRGEASLTVNSREIAQRAAADVSGEYRRLDEGGVLTLEPSRIRLDGIGEVRIDGTVHTFSGETPPRASIGVEISSTDLREAAARVPHGLVPPELRAAILDAGLAGRIDAALRIRGTPERPETTGCFEVREFILPLMGADLPPLTARGTLDDVRIDSESGEMDIGRLQLDVDGFPAAAGARVLGASVWRASGDLGAQVEVTGACLPLERSTPRASLDLEWTSGALDQEGGFTGATGITSSATIEGTFLPLENTVEVDIDATLRLDEVLVGSFYARAAGRPARLAAKGALRWSQEWDIEAVSLEGLRAETPFTGRVMASGSLSRETSGLVVRGTLDLPEIPLDEAFRAFIRDGFSSSLPILEGSGMDGEGSLSARVEGPIGAPRITGRLALSRASADLKGVAVEGLEAEIPFETGAPPGANPFTSTGAVRAGRFAAGPLEARDLEIPFRLERGTYSLESPRRLDVLGGTVEITGASFSPAGRLGPTARVAIRASDLDVGRMTRGWGLPEVEGTLEMDLHPLQLTGKGRLDARGTVILRAFGGAISFTDVVIENVGKPYSDLSLGRGHVQGVRLLDLGRTFRFGLMSGVLEGVILGLQITGGDVTSFEADIQTVRTPGVPQYVDRRAIESIRRIMSGPLGAIEESLFSRFYFDRFGFWCSLRDGIFRLQGKYAKGGVEYVMYSRWYRFPRIDIVNVRPDMPYDWRSILANLRAIYAGGELEGR